MTSGFSNTRRASWESPQCPFRIEFNVDVLNQIRIAAVEAFYSVPRGGVEIGGVLYGNSNEQRVLIQDFRRIDCEYASGPSFLLSPRDKEGLQALLDQCANDPQLRDKQRIGWFHSHTRSQIFLSPADLDLHRQYFPGPREVALVVRPAHLQPTRAGFFFRDPEGRIHAETTYHEFNADPAFLRTYEGELPPPKGPEKPRSRPLGPIYGWLLLFLLLGIGVGASAFALRDYLFSDAQPTLGLEATDFSGDIVVRWNRYSPAAVQAQSGTLDISDGTERRAFPLDAQQVRFGLWRYSRNSSHQEIHLIVRPTGKLPVEESVTFYGPPLVSQAETIQSLQAENEELKKRNRALEAELRNRLAKP